MSGAENQKALSAVLANERQLKELMEWMLAWVPKALGSHEALAKRVLIELWNASTLEAQDGETIEEQYANVRSDGLGNVFRGVRRGEKGAGELAHHRYWLTRFAHALSMNEAFEWAGVVYRELKGSGLANETSYRAKLKEMVQ